MDHFRHAVKEVPGAGGCTTKFTLMLAAKRFKELLFSAEALAAARNDIRTAVGLSADQDVVAEGQVMHLPLIGQVLRACGDPDWELFEGLGDGVNVGVDEELPRTPAVFEEKDRWRLPDDAGPGEDLADNYKSAEPHLSEVEKLFE